VRSGDYEGYLCGLFVPSSGVHSYYVMRALNIEVASVRDAARSNPSAAHLRMGFWRDLVNACVVGVGGWEGCVWTDERLRCSSIAVASAARRHS
jgi:hypothetical protein